MPRTLLLTAYLGAFDVGLVGGPGLTIGRGRGRLTLNAADTLGLLDANVREGFTARDRTLRLGVGVRFPII